MLLTDSIDRENVRKIIVPQSDFKPCPSVEDRTVWEQIRDQCGETVITKSEELINHQWQVLPAYWYMDFKKNGDRQRYENIYFERRNVLLWLVISECMEGKGRFIESIINGIWCICEESTWVVPAHNGYLSYHGGYYGLPDITEQVIDLFAGETAALMAWTHYLLKSRLDQIDPLICIRIEQEVRRRILEPYIKRNDFWWMGFIKILPLNNWNPWCNSNCLIAFLLLEQNNDIRSVAVYKMLRSLEAFLECYHTDGGCEEGPAYWEHAAGAFFSCLELLYQSTNGKINFFSEEKIRNMGKYICKAHIADKYFVNFSDSAAKLKLDGSLIYRYGKQICDENLMALGSLLHSRCKSWEVKKQFYSASKIIYGLLLDKEVSSYSRKPYYEQDKWLDRVDIMISREIKEENAGFFLAAKGGHNGVSHNHNDVGSFIVFFNGKPMLCDAGVGIYTAKTFSEERYSIWTMQSAYHNLPTINGCQQKNGEEYKAKAIKHHFEQDRALLSMDISSAYPDNAGVRFWNRTFELIRGQNAQIIITDEFESVEAPIDILWSFIVPSVPKMIDYGNQQHVIIGEQGQLMKMEFHGLSLKIDVEEIELQDERLNDSWGSHLYRILLKPEGKLSTGRLQVKCSRGELKHGISS